MKKEVSLILNTGEGQVSIETDKLIGELNSIIIDSPVDISLSIESELGYLVFKKREISGTHCLAVRNRTIAPEENMMDVTQFDKFYLNESLIITIIGPKKNDVVVILRLE